MFLYYILCLFSIPLAMANGTVLGAIKPGCQTQCGSVTVPYPFGIAKGNDTSCSLNNDFFLTCNTSSEPPKLFHGDGNIEVYNISDSELRIKSLPAFRCYYQNGTVSDDLAGGVDLKIDKYSLSEKNKLTVIGCDDYSLIKGRTLKLRTNDFSSGCISSCIKESDVPVDGQCSGRGCCLISIAKGLQSYEVELNSFQNHIDVWSFNRCSFAFLGEEGSFKFRGASDLSNYEDLWSRIRTTVPVVIDWVIATSRSCSEATECKENSECYDVEGGGYRCRCKRGYEGNPYLDSGCQDIDECVDLRNNTCYGDCINTNGSYNCTCPLGYSGDAKTQNGCQDINECSDQGAYPCYGDCINTLGSYRCNCPPGYFGDAKVLYGCRKFKRSKKFPIIFILLGVLLGTGLLVLAIWMYKVVQKREDKKLREKCFKRNGGLLLQQQTSNGEDAIERTRMFSARELEKATDQYNNNRVVGRGGQGTVYKGMLPDGKIVAVKKSVSVDETQIEPFINEVFLLSQISHRNVVKLLGCCLETEVPVLVYEFVSNGDLFQFIHDENYEFPTLWSIRITIATEVAGALAYMHTATSIPIYHRDIKSSNILLDEKFRAKLSDFGISKSVMGDQTHLSTLAKGTYGYMDPEYFQSNQFTEKSDVYSFGIVLVELLTGKKPIYSIGPGESRSLATLILSMEEGLILENIDDRVSDGPKEQLIEVAKLAKRCLNLNGKLRPTMKEVAMELEGIRSSSH